MTNISTKEQRRKSEIAGGPDIYALERLAGLSKPVVRSNCMWATLKSGNGLPKSVYFILSDGSSFRVDEMYGYEKKADRVSFRAANVCEGIKTYAEIRCYSPSLKEGGYLLFL